MHTYRMQANLSARLGRYPLFILFAGFLTAVFLSTPVQAQNASSSGPATDSATLPSEPEAQTPAQTGQAKTATPEPPDQPSKRILGIIPNYRSVAVDAKLPPQSVREKGVTALQDSFDPGAFELAAIVSAYNYATVQTPEFHRGIVAYGRYYWHTLTDQTIENASVEFIVPALTHEDTRYYTLGRGGFVKRATYSLSRIAIGRTDAGNTTVNLGELVGAGMAAGIGSLYYPSSDQTASKILKQYGLNLGIDAASFMVREFDNDLTHAFSRHHRQVASQP
jgi:hypothetical protein